MSAGSGAASDAEVDRKLAEIEREVAQRRPLSATAGAGVGPVERRAMASRYRDRSDDGPGWRFLIGAVIALFGVWAFLSNVVVTSGFVGGFFGYMPGMGAAGFGWTLLPIVAGLTLVVARPGVLGKLGWLLILAGILFIIAEVLSSLHIWFRPVSLPILLMMIAPIGIGLGLILSDFRRRNV